MERLFWFTLELKGGPLAEGHEKVASRVAAANPDVVFSRFQGREFARYTRLGTSLEGVTLQAMREIKNILPDAHLVNIIERSPSSPAALA